MIDKEGNFQLNINSDVINRGRPTFARTCPIAVAFTEQITNKETNDFIECNVYVASTTLHNQNKSEIELEHDPHIMRWIRYFDSYSTQPHPNRAPSSPIQIKGNIYTKKMELIP